LGKKDIATLIKYRSKVNL